jgi:hypothetical protein
MTTGLKRGKYKKKPRVVNFAKMQMKRLIDNSRDRKRNPNKRDDVLTLVYVVKAGPFIKIGIAENLKTRMIVIQTGCPLPIEVIWHSKSMLRPLAREIEVKCHNHIIGHHVRGEWFEIDQETILAFVKTLADEDIIEVQDRQLRLIA